MTKIRLKNVLTAEEIYDKLDTSPYYNVAWKIMNKKSIEDPSVGDLLIAFHEIAKIDHKINKRKD